MSSNNSRDEDILHSHSVTQTKFIPRALYLFHKHLQEQSNQF